MGDSEVALDVSRMIGEQLSRYFAAHPAGIAAAWLFGSVARGTAGARSDVDVAVLFADAAGRSRVAPTALRLEGQLERALGRPTHVVKMNDAPVDLIHRVLRDGQLVCEGDRRARVRFEVRARNEYFDLLPVLQRYRRAREPV